MISRSDLEAMVRIIHRHHETSGVPIGYYDGSQCRVLNAGSRTSNASGVFGVAIEEVLRPIPNRRRIRQGEAVVVQGAPQELRNGSRLAEEAMSAGLSCAFAAIAAYGVGASAAAEVPTGGASTLLLVASWTGMIASGIQCGDGIGRTWEALSNPNGTTIARADNDPVYAGYRDVVDATGIVASGVSVAGSRRLVLDLNVYMDQVFISATNGSINHASRGTRRDLPRLPRRQPNQSELHTSIVVHVYSRSGRQGAGRRGSRIRPLW